MTKPMKQEQEPASEEVTEVAPGVLRLQLPIDMPGLGHVNCYALEDERGVALVDPGLPGPESWAALQDRLRQAGMPMARVHTVVVTHSHPDHFGLAGRIQEEVGADMLTHDWFRMWWNPDEPRRRPRRPGRADGPTTGRSHRPGNARRRGAAAPSARPT